MDVRRGLGGANQVFNRGVKHLSDTDQGLNGRVLVGTGFKLDDGVVVHLGLTGEFVTGQVFGRTHLFERCCKLAEVVLLFHTNESERSKER